MSHSSECERVGSSNCTEGYVRCSILDADKLSAMVLSPTTSPITLGDGMQGRGRQRKAAMNSLTLIHLLLGSSGTIDNIYGGTHYPYSESC